MNLLTHRRLATCLATIFSLTSLLSISNQQANAATTDVYLAGAAYVGQGQVITNVAMVVREGRIVTIGPRSEVTLPSGATIHDLGSVTLAPGLVIAETNLADRGVDEDEALTPFIRAIDGFDFFGDYDSLLATGITTVQVSPGRARLMPGQGAVVKLGGEDPQQQSLNASESLRILLTEEAFNPPRIYKPPVGAVSVDRPLEPTQPQLANNLGDAVIGLRALMIARAAEDAQSDLVLGTLNEVLNAGKQLRITARSAGELAAAHRIAEEFQVPYLLVGADEVVSASQSIPWSGDLLRGVVLAGKSGAASLTNQPVPKPNETPISEPWERAAALIKAGAKDKLAITVPNSELTDIWYLAGNFLAAGLEPHEVLSMLTAIPARLLSVDSRVGSLAEGKDADFLVLSGKPFAPSTRVLETYIDGKQVYQRPQSAKSKVIRAATIHGADGKTMDGEIVVQDKVIRGVGSSVSFPSDAEISEFPGAVVVPGFIDMATRVGTGTDLNDRVGLNDRLGRLLVSDDDQVAMARQGGVTTGLLSSSGLPSPVVAFKLGNIPRVLQDPVAIRYSISGNLTSEEAKLKATLAAGQKYAETWVTYDQAYAAYQKQLAEYEQAKAKYDAAIEEQKKKAEAEKQKAEAEANAKPATGAPSGDAPKPDAPKPDAPKPDAPKPDAPKPDAPKPDAPKPDAPKPDAAKPDDSKPDAAKSDESKPAEALVEPKKPEEPKKPNVTDALEPYRLLFAKKIVAIVEVGDGLAVDLAVKLFVDEFKLRTILAASGTAYRQASALSDKQVSVVLSPPLDTVDDGQPVSVAQQFLAAGVPVTIESRAGTGAVNLTSAIGFSVYRGLGGRDALAGLTSVPAAQLSLASVGSIKEGNDADFVVLSGEPFHAGTRVLAVMIDGDWVYKADDKEGAQ